MMAIAQVLDEPTPPRLEIPIPNVNLTEPLNDAGYLSLPWLGQYISGIYRFLIGIVGVVAGVMMIVGGFQYLTSAGDKGKLGAGKKRIVDALIGLSLALGSYVILYAINPNLVEFKALQLTNVSYIALRDYNDLPSPDSAPPPAGTVAIPSSGGTRTSVCSTVAGCLPYCRAAGCTTVLCYPGERPPAGFTCTPGGAFSNNCKLASFPSLTTNDILPPTSPNLILSSRWPRIPNVIANGVIATQLVVERLQRASNYIDAHYPGQGYKLIINNCWRDYRSDFGAQCAIMMRTTGNDPHASGSTWPGGNPHAAGYACDLALAKNGTVISGNSSNQRCSSRGPANRLLVEIMTNQEVGARRLNYESWHFNWAGFNSCYCAGAECEAHIFPIMSNCTAQSENTSC